MRVQAALGQAVMTMLGETLPLLSGGATSRELWPRAFAESYRTELRAEGDDRSRQLHHAFAARYEQITRILAPQLAQSETEVATRRRWRRRRVLGKLLSVLRLIKASFTFEGGADYLAWKIGRHSGVEIELTPGSGATRFWLRRCSRLAAVPGRRVSLIEASGVRRAHHPCRAGSASRPRPCESARRPRRSASRLCAADTLQRSRHAAFGVPGGSARLT